MYLVQKLWMSDTKGYVLEHTPAFSKKMLKQGLGTYDDNMFKYNLNQSIGLLLKSICPKLKALHDNGYVHMDIKTHNICMDWDKDKNKALGFGLIDFELISKNGRQLPDCIGTIGRHSPEMIVKDKTKVVITDKFDIYALGITIIELINGKHPYLEELRKLYKNKEIANCEYYGFLKGRFIFDMVSNDEVLKKREHHFFKHLVYHMILPNSKKRYNIDQVMAHKWYKSHCV